MNDDVAAWARAWVRCAPVLPLASAESDSAAGIASVNASARISGAGSRIALYMYLLGRGGDRSHSGNQISSS